MALIHEPPVLFLDEPTSGLDVMSTRKIRSFVGELRDQGITVFMTTHNISEAEDLCDRVAVIDEGRIAAIDTPEHLRRTFEVTQAVEVAFEEEVAIDVLRSLSEVSRVRRLGDRFRLYTPSPGDLATDLVLFAKDNGLHMSSISTLGPSLEDVFVELTTKEEET
jgi:ABC-2 type transport system ATP-binding protein